VINPEEADAWKFSDLRQVQKDAEANPDRYTRWFQLILRHPRWATSG
jgi:isopentenyldiphosphate isomerase